VIPYTLEMEALRQIPKAVFGVMMSLEPAVAALVGLLLSARPQHDRSHRGRLVVVASAGALRSGASPPPVEP
jgi:inner membrane transporter RhtA